MSQKMRLGEILIAKGLVSAAQVAEAVRVQVGGNRRLGSILIKMGIISDDQLLDVLSDQLKVPIISISKEFQQEAGTVLPRHLCRKYSVVPIAKEPNNILSLAMMDPSDDTAIDDIESYTGMVVKPVLAREKDITAAIGRLISFSFHDIVNPQTFSRVSRFLSLIALLLLLVVGGFIYTHLQAEKYGKVSVIGTSKTFKNHDLMVGVEENGRISLLGHGAYAKGYYSVTFNSLKAFENFVAQKRKNFSDKQHEWLVWVTEENIKPAGRP